MVSRTIDAVFGFQGIATRAPKKYQLQPEVCRERQQPHQNRDTSQSYAGRWGLGTTSVYCRDCGTSYVERH